MLSPKFTTKRVLGATMAAALAVSGVVALAANSEAASVAALKLSPATGATAGGTVVTITGKGFASVAGITKVGTVWFETNPCDVADRTTNPVVNPSAISPTKLTVLTPVLALASSPAPTVYNLCVSNVANTVVLGAGKYSAYPKVTINTTASGATIGLSPILGSSAGGGTVTIQGENFTKKTTATVGGLPLTKVSVDIGASTTASTTAGDDTLTGTLPAGTGAANLVVLTSEGGASLASAVNFGYVSTVGVSPSSGDGTAKNGITVTGKGFTTKTFVSLPASAIAGTAVVALSKATTALTVGGAIPVVTLLCGNIQVESDTSLTCELPVVAAAAFGPYTIQVVDGAAGPVIGANISGVTASATYTVGAF
jgi:hypothetical protein